MQRVKYLCIIFLFSLFSKAQDQLPGPIQECQSELTSCTLKQNVTTGHTILIGGSSRAALTVPTDTFSTTYTLLESNTITQQFAYTWCGILTSGGGTDTITLNGTTSTPMMIVVELPSSVGCTLDGTAHTNGSYTGTPSTVTTSSITTSTNGDFIFSYISGREGNGRFFPHDPILGLISASDGGSDAGGYIISGVSGNSYNTIWDNINNTQGGWTIVALKPSSINIVTTKLPTGSIGVSYSYTLQAVGGIGAYTWSLSSGSLPGGLSINSSGVVSGTPTSGSTSPTFGITDGTNTTTTSLTLTINAITDTINFINSAAAASGETTPISLGTVTINNNIFVAKTAQNGAGNGSACTITPPTDSLG